MARSPRRGGHAAGQTRSTLQRVGYRLDEGTLYRLYWSELDRALESKANEAQLLDGVTNRRPITVLMEGLHCPDSLE